MKSLSQKKRLTPSGASRPAAAGFLALLWLWGEGVLIAFPAPAAFEAEKALLAKGQYRDAIARLTTVLKIIPGEGEAAVLLLEARLEIGEYRAALQQSEEWLQRRADPAIHEKAAEAAYRLGEYDRAAGFLQTVSTVRAEWWKGLLAKVRGRKQDARAAFAQVAARGGRASLTAGEKSIVAAALAELGKFQDANQLYREASESEPENASIKAEWGWLLLEKHNPGDAQSLFREALGVNPNHTRALVGLAALGAGRGENEAREALDRALKVNPNLAEARVALAEALLEQEDYPAAAEQLQAALTVNPRMLPALSLQAVSEYLQGRTEVAEKELIPRILSQNPAFGKVFADLGDFCVQRRQYAPAVEFYRRAVATDPDLAGVRATLGINLFRLGKEEEARSVMEEAYQQDPFNVETVNTLRLMDSFRLYDTLETERFQVKLQKKESALLWPYVENLTEKALGDLTAQYGYRPAGKILLELYPDHDDFAVRTLGLPGLGALGASFGPVVAMDSPSARPPGEFHWGSTLWHELTHVITLGLTDNRVPRWFTEGLSVYEETRAQQGWGDPMSPAIVQALQRNSLIPLEKLNGVFVRPEYPAQIPFAYFQSGLICEFIAEEFGFPKILEMLRAYKKGLSDRAAIGEALGLSPAEFDAQFRAYAQEQTYGFAKALDLRWANADRPVEELREEVARNPGNFFAQLHLAAAFAKQSRPEEALPHAKAAQELFPLYVEDGDPYRILADIYESQGQKEKAAAELLEWKKQKGRDPETFLRLADLLQATGRTDEAIRTLEDALYVSLFNLKVHERLGEWYFESNNPRAAVREYQAVLALDPVDKAEAHYRLATAYRALSDNSSARKQVLAALEIAPGFRPAQKLLLELSGK